MYGCFTRISSNKARQALAEKTNRLLRPTTAYLDSFVQLLHCLFLPSAQVFASPTRKHTVFSSLLHVTILRSLLFFSLYDTCTNKPREFSTAFPRCSPLKRSHLSTLKTGKMATTSFLTPGRNILKLSLNTSVLIDLPADISDDASISELLVHLGTALATIGSSQASQDRILPQIRPAHEHARGHPNSVGCQRRLSRWESLNGLEHRCPHRTSCISKVARFGSPHDIHPDLWEMATRQEPAIGTKQSILDWFSAYCEGEQGRTPRDCRSYVDELRLAFADEVTAFGAVLSIMAFLARGTTGMDQGVWRRYQGMANSMWSTVMSNDLSLQTLRCPVGASPLAPVSQLRFFFWYSCQIPVILMSSPNIVLTLLFLRDRADELNLKLPHGRWK